MKSFEAMAQAMSATLISIGQCLNRLGQRY